MKSWRDRRGKRQSLSEMNVVPYIDVMLVLVVIFMVTTPLLSQGVKVNLPQAQAKALSEKDQIPLILTVDAKGQYFLNVMGNHVLSSRQLLESVQSQLSKNPHRKFYVRGDASASYGEVIKAMVLLQKAGIGDVGLMTDPVEKP